MKSDFFFSLKGCTGDIILKLENTFLKDINLSHNNEEIVMKNLRWLIMLDNCVGEKLTA